MHSVSIAIYTLENEYTLPEGNTGTSETREVPIFHILNNLILHFAKMDAEDIVFSHPPSSTIDSLLRVFIQTSYKIICQILGYL